MAKQVEKTHYETNYLREPRMFSYFFQIKEALKLVNPPKRILLIGVGDGVVPFYLKKIGFDLTTIDIDPDLKPDVVGDVLKMPFPDDAFDLAVCAEVLEHLPFEKFPAALTEIGLVTKQGLILSLPDKRRTLLDLRLKLPLIKQIDFFYKIDLRRAHVFDGQHYWEIGKKDYSLRKVIFEIEETGFKLMRHYVKSQSPNIHFFVLGKKI